MKDLPFDVRDGVAVITLENPPVNGLSHALRSGIVAGLDRANADPEIRAVVLIGTGKGFSGGADITEFGKPSAMAAPNLRTVIDIIEANGKPVVAAVHGLALGGGLELALGCHYRVASPDASIGLPEVKLGLLPGAGGTQRFPRAVGLETALNMIVSGEPVKSQYLKGLFDEIIEGDLVDGAVAYANSIADARPLPQLRTKRVQHPNPEGFLHVAAMTVQAVAKGYPAPMKCVEAVKAAVSEKFDRGMQVELDAFAQLLQSSESASLRHIFFSERATAHIPDVPRDTPTRPIEKAAVLGAGTMGSGIAMCFAAAGIPVALYEREQAPLERGMGAIQGYFASRAKKGKMTPEAAEQKASLVTPTLELSDIGDADLVIEAVFEDMGVKKQVFQALDEVMKDGAILASNTSTLDLNEIAASTKRPQDVVGLHFFSPAQVMRLLEVVRGDATAKDVLATVMKLGKKLKKTTVVSGVCDGFIGNRMVGYYVREALMLVEEGAMPAQVDKVLEKFGMAMGPFRMGDLSGNDIGWAIRKRQYEEDPNAPRLVTADRLCEAGRFGQKTGLGWYRYEGRKHIEDPEVTKLILETSEELGVERRKISAEEIIDRTILALVNEGARILEEGIALRASDIDMAYIMGYGFPPFRGGPMHYAETRGLFDVVRRMKQLHGQVRSGADFWEPAGILNDLAESGQSFSEWSKQ